MPLAPAQPGTSQSCDSAAHRLSSDVDKPTHALPFQAEAPGPQAHTQEPTLHNYVRDCISDTMQQVHSDLAASQPVPSLELELMAFLLKRLSGRCTIVKLVFSSLCYSYSF